MFYYIRSFFYYLSLYFCTISILIFSKQIFAADHGDTPLLVTAGRHDARITDFYAFVRQDQLVLAMAVDPSIPPEVTEYIFPSDVAYRFFVDNNSEVHFDNTEDLLTYGGTIDNPEDIREDIGFQVNFDERGNAKLLSLGLRSEYIDRIQLFTGLRDDPFIRAPRTGRNVAAIVLALPLSAVIKDSYSTLLLWSMTDVQSIDGPIEELGGRSLRSQFPEFDDLNTTHPCRHYSKLGLVPDVVIFNTAKLPATYPNGRELTDDVVDLVGDPRPLQNDAPYPSENDVPFLDNFPFLAPPHVL